MTYLVAEVDNRQGTQPQNAFMVGAYNEEGRQFTFSMVTDVINEWSPRRGPDQKYRTGSGDILDDTTGDALHEQGVELYNTHVKNIAAGERSTIVLASTDDELPTKFARVVVRPAGAGDEGEAAGEQEAIPAT